MDTKRIAVTIARQMGAGGVILGQRIARRLGYAYLDRVILKTVAERTGISDTELSRWDEHLSRFWERLAETFVVAPPEAVYTPAPIHIGVRDQQLFQLESQIISEAASRHNVVVIGRGGFWVLRDHPGLVSVYLHAPLRDRIPRVMQAHQIPDERAARTLIEHTDADRMRFIHQMTGRSANDALGYHLSIDTSRAGMDLAEDMVVKLAERVQARIAPGQ
ncbi:MAG: cytidylate kinase-like family protein [Phycisphaeraceae bacterium]